MQDKLIEAAQEVEGPFIVESEGRGCDKCGAGEFWNVVFKPEDVALSTAYGDKEEAEDLAEDLNNAFRKGVSSVRAHDAGAKTPNSEQYENAPQLAAEDPAEPVEDVVSRMCKAFGKNGISPYIWRDEMTAAFVEARKGYYSQQDMEKAILAQARGFQVIPVDELPEFLKQALAPKPSPKVPYADCDAVDQWYVVDERGEQIEICFTNKRDAERYAAGLRAELAALVERKAGK